MRQKLIDTARDYTGDGISITLTDDRKVSIGSWKDFQSRLITQQEIAARADIAQGIAIICGKISGNLEVIDIDLKYDVTGKLWTDLLQAIPEAIMNKMVVAKTKSNGYHLYYRCSSVSPNSKLARRPATDDEITANPNLKVFVLIETRGEGGYVVAPPTDGYEWISGTITEITLITDEDKEQLWETCRMFNTFLEEPERIIETSIGVSPCDDFNQRGDAIGLLERHGWKVVRNQGDKTFLRRPGKEEGTSGDWIESKRWFSVFSTSTQFEPNRAYNASALYCYLECAGNWKKATSELAALGYGKNEKELKQQNEQFKYIKLLRDKGTPDNQIAEKLAEKTNDTIQGAYHTIKSFDDDQQLKEIKFWEISKAGKVIIDKVKLINFLCLNGFRVMPYDEAGNDVRMVSVDQNIIWETSIEKVKKVIYDFVTALKTDEGHQVASAILDKHQLFNTSFLEFMPKVPNEFLRDDQHNAYFPFKNGIVKVTAEGTSIVQYSDVKGFIWHDDIIDRNISLEKPREDGLERIYDLESEHGDVFPRFIHKIAGQNDDRFTAVCTHIGYCLHKYKDPKLPVAIILAEETDNDNDGGGTGKGIFTTAIGYLNNTVTIDGKTFRPDKPFAFQRCNVDTKIIIIQDTRKGFDFEGIYSAITDGLTVEKKGQPEIFLSYDKSPKFIITTNYSINDTSNHAKRRQRVIPFSGFFSPKWTPFDEFNQHLFTDWSDDEWKTFYNYMFYCVRCYIKNGLIPIPITDGIRLKSLKTSYGIEFRNFFENLKTQVPTDWISFKELYRNFVTDYDLPESEFTRKKFRLGIQAGCSAFDIQMETLNRGTSGGMCYKFSKRIND